MHLKTLLLVSALASLISYLPVPTEAFGSLILAVGTTSYVLTSAQVTLGIAGLAALALVKEKLILAGISRGRRSVDTEDTPLQNNDLDKTPPGRCVYDDTPGVP